MGKKIIKESKDVQYIREFIGHICSKDFAKANGSLNLAVREKVKNLIKNTIKEND